VDIIRRAHDPVWKLPTAAVNFQPDPSVQTEAARAKLARWQNSPERKDWRAVWVLGQDNRPWPLFVRLEGQGAHGEPGIQDSQFSEVLEWDPELKPPDPGNPSGYPQVVIGMIVPRKGGLFSPPNVKF